MFSPSSVRYIANEKCYLHNGQRKFDVSDYAPERDIKVVDLSLSRPRKTGNGYAFHEISSRQIDCRCASPCASCDCCEKQQRRLERRGSYIHEGRGADSF